MAAGDAVYFDEYILADMKGEHNLQDDDLRAMLLTSVVAAQADEEPSYDKYSGSELQGSTSNPEGGRALSNRTTVQSGGDGVFDSDPLTFPQEGVVSPATIEQIVIYNNSHPTKAAIFFIDAASWDLTAASLTSTPDAAGVILFSRSP